MVFAPGDEVVYPERERVLVTFNSLSGANTNAKLELTTSASDFPIVRRRVFDGGAQWVVSSLPTYDSGGRRVPTHYEFTVQSFVDGVVTVEDMGS